MELLEHLKIGRIARVRKRVPLKEMGSFITRAALLAPWKNLEISKYLPIFR